MNHGLLPSPPQPQNGLLGGPGGELPVLSPSGDWEAFLPGFERQNKLGLETMNCVQFSRLNVCEAQANFYKKPLNLSDRFLYWATGCTERGNSYTSCDFWIKQRGACPEPTWPWEVAMDRAEYGKEPSADVQAEAKKLLDEWTFGMLVAVPITIEDMRRALTHRPIWFCTETHSMMIYRVDDMVRIFDTYPDSGEGRLDWTHEQALAWIYAAYLAPFTPKHLTPTPMIQLPKNSLVIVADTGERLMNIDGTKLYKDDAGKILLEVIARNAVGATSQNFPIVHLLAKDVADIPRVNLKGEPA